jgi:SAM-dependent methyltransferase
VDRLNLGAGNRIIGGAVNHDRVKHRPEIDVAWDLSILPWPWADNSFDVIVAWAVFEHLRQTLVETLNECWRILRPGGTINLKLPIATHDRAHDDPTHYWAFTVRSLDYFDPDTKYGKGYWFYTDRHWRILSAPKLNNATTSFYATMQVRK